MVTELAIDPSVRVTDGGRVLVGGSPLRVLRLSEAGARVVADVMAGRAVAGDGRASVARLLDRLVDAGLAHPRPTAGPFTEADVAVVIPSRGRAPRLVPGRGPGSPAVVVVDDGSEPPLGPIAGATVVRRAPSGGPAAARNTGWPTVDAPLVAFVDADCAPPPGWLGPLLAHFGDPRVAAVAPRIASEAGPGPLARYEATGSPLDLGPLEGRVAPMTRIAYVPATALVVRRAALEELGGFAEDLRFGEDVDLVWRLVAAGHRVRYDPRSVVVHEPRATLAGWARQRFDYGSSSGPLAVRHPGALTPLAVSGWSVAAWGLVAARRPVAGVAVAAGTTALLARKLAASTTPAAKPCASGSSATCTPGGPWPRPSPGRGCRSPSPRPSRRGRPDGRWRARSSPGSRSTRTHGRRRNGPCGSSTTPRTAPACGPAAGAPAPSGRCAPGSAPGPAARPSPRTGRPDAPCAAPHVSHTGRFRRRTMLEGFHGWSTTTPAVGPPPDRRR